MLQVLAGVGEVQAVQLGVGARGGVGDRGRQPYQVAAEGRHERAEHRVAAEPGVVVGDVHRVVLPLLQAHHPQRGAVADHELDVVGVGRAAGVLDDDGRLGELAHVDDEVAVGGAPALAAHPDGDRPVERLVRRDRDDHGLLERDVRLGGDPVGGLERAADARVLAARRVDHDLVGRVHLDRDRAGGLGRAVVQPLEPGQRGEPPVLLAAGRDREEPVEVARAERRGVHGQGVAAGRQRLDGLQAHGQPTAPSICSSISRLSSSAYSMGSSRAIGSTKPRTIIAIASSSDRPRLIR